MSNPLYTYILNIYDLVWLGWVLWHINHCRLFNAKSSSYIYIKFLLIMFLNEPKLTVKWLQVLLYIAIDSIKQSFVYTQLNDQTVLFQTIQCSISHLFILFQCQTVLFDL